MKNTDQVAATLLRCKICNTEVWEMRDNVARVGDCRGAQPRRAEAGLQEMVELGYR